MKRTLVRLGLAALVTSVLVGCSGGANDGINGAPGAPGAPGAQGPAGGGINIAALTTDQWADLKLQGQVTAVTINSPPEVTFTLTDASGNPIVGLEKNTSKSSTATLVSYSNVSLSIAKLVPGTNGSPSKWVSYIVTTVPTTDKPTSVSTRPSTDNTGTLTYNGNGTYTYKFWRDIKTVKDVVAASAETATNKNADLDDLTYDPALVHRVAIQISGSARGTGTNTANASTGAPSVLLKDPINITYDFVPATGLPAAPAAQREIVSFKACFECHTKFVGFHGSTPELGLAGVGASRQDTRMCMVCHTDQRKYGRSNSTATAGVYSGSTYRVADKSLLDFPTFVHKIHMGEELVNTGYNIAGVKPNEIKYPQLITNCTKCHDGTSTAKNVTAQGDNWNTVPNRAACGSCHDGIDFAANTGTKLDGRTDGHSVLAGPQADDSNCASSSCHSSTAIRENHASVTPPNLNSSLFLNGTDNNTNAAWIAANRDNLPAGAIKVDYEIKSVSRNASKQPVIVFRLLQNGVAVDLKSPPPAGSSSAVLSASEIWDNFMGAPSVYFVFAVPQDGVAAPADFNASASSYLRNLWNGTDSGTSAGDLTGPDVPGGFYTATLTGVTVPDNAVMLTGGVGYSYAPGKTMPITQTNLAKYPVAAATAASGLTAGMPNKTGGLIVVAPDKQVVASAGCTAPAVCTSSGGYVGRRVIVEDARCNNCHKELGVFNKASFHAGQRNDGTTCSWCHTPNRASSGWSADSTNFVHAIHGSLKRGDDAKFTWHAASTTEGFWSIGYPGVLSNCEACHVPGSYDFSNPVNRAAADNRLYRTAATGTFSSTEPDPVKVFSYSPYVLLDNNYGAGFSFNAGTGATTAAAGTTLVESPTATVCFACHTKPLARSHMEFNGGSIYEARSTALGKTEQCLICHDSGRIADIKAVHSK